ncbi:MAG TPA: gluconeogenesis factor YvcK family protein [Chloroflexota bacterium]|jgi:uncharacterized cofD-like protein|nr:gluconeogenesis factor YvcK family protein [Chloroflexota bacterium]
MLKLLLPGLHLKRWLVMLLVGMVVISLGIGYTLSVLYRSITAPDWVSTATLQFMPLWLRALLFLAFGAVLCALALRGLYRSLSTAVPATGNSNQSLLERIYEYRFRQGGPRIVCIGGGTGMPAVLRGLKQHSANITAIVTVGDDGGSSGRLRREHGILPPGDFRNNIVALAEVEPLMARLFQYRFGAGTDLGGHSFGNLFVLAMTGITGNFEHALRETSRVLAVQGTILPSTLQNVEICAEFSDGSEVCGESQIPEAGKPIKRVWLKPGHPAAQPEAVSAVLEADLIVLGPGSLYTSVVPNLLVEGVGKALLQSDALKIYVCNVATQPGETDGYDVQAHVAALERHLPGQVNPLDVVLAAAHSTTPVDLDPSVSLVTASTDLESHPRVVVEDVLRDDQPLRHDPHKLGTAIMRLFAEQRHRVPNGTVRSAR